MFTKVSDYTNAIVYLKKYNQISYVFDIEHNKELNIYVDDVNNVNAVVLEFYPHQGFGIFSHNKDTLDKIYEHFMGETKKYLWIECVDTEIAKYFVEKYCFKFYSDCFVYEYEGMAETPSPYKIRPIKVKDYKLVKEKYTYPVRMKDIKESGKNYPSSAIYIDGQMVCWCMVHEDGSMGPIFTLPEYRGRDLAVYVTQDLTQKMLALGMKPFFHIIKGNTSSEKLSTKVGFVNKGQSVAWIGRENYKPKP